MGVMIDGTYHFEDPTAGSVRGGEFKRAASTIRNWITTEGRAGPTGEAGFSADPDRYHLYAAWNCPWAHRALLTRKVLGLEDVLSVSYARPRRTEDGWVFDQSGEFSDQELGVSALHEVYSRHPNGYTGRITVPVLWDRARQMIVSNESADIIRMLNQAYPSDIDLCPDEVRSDIDSWNDLIYPTLNNGVYRAGFARTQDAYQTAAFEVFDTLDKIETQLGKTRFLTGDTLTEADIRLFPTLARFDVAYHTAFKCNLRRITDYPNLWAYARDIYCWPGIAATVRFDIYKAGYFSPSDLRNPLGIVPIGPDIDWTAPHGRGDT